MTPRTLRHRLFTLLLSSCACSLAGAPATLVAQSGAQVEQPSRVDVEVDSIAPSAAAAGTVVQVTIRGRGFDSGTVVLVGGKPASHVRVTDETTLEARVPRAVAGLADVVIIRSTGERASLPGAFLYLTRTADVKVRQVKTLSGSGASSASRGAKPPVAGAAAPATRLALTGEGFSKLGDAPIVTVGGVNATSVKVISDTQLQLEVLAPADGAFDINVASVNGAIGATAPRIVRAGVAAGALGDADGDGLPDDWETQFGFDPAVVDDTTADPDGDGLTNAQELAAGSHPRGFHTRYLAEGATGFFGARIALANAGDLDSVALLRFLKKDGTKASERVVVPKRSRRTVDVQSLAGMAEAEFATVVESDEQLVVDRTLKWDQGSGYGAHAETAVYSSSTTWYLAEGATHSGLDLFYLVQNPDPARAAEVTIRYLLPIGSPIEKSYSVPAGSRFNVWVNKEQFPEGSGTFPFAGTDVSAAVTVTNGVPVIVERALYLSSQGRTFNAGHESAGVTSPSTRWFLAEGATGDFLDLFVLIANPNPAAASVKATYLLPDGTTVAKSYQVGPNSRYTAWVDYEDAKLASTAVSSTLESTNGVPIIVERAMWWPGNGDGWYEAHNSSGSTTTSTDWALAEGEEGGPTGIRTYILLANASSRSGGVTVTLLYEDGTTESKVFTVPATSRTNVSVVDEFPNAAGKRFGATVHSDGIELAVERAMYWDANGVFWAAGTNALATDLRGRQVTSLQTDTVYVGRTVTMDIEAQNTNFVDGQTRVDLGGGVEVVSVVVLSPTKVRVTFTVDPGAEIGARRVRVTSGGQTVELDGQFAVFEQPLTIDAPSTLSFVNTPSITVTGKSTRADATVKVNSVDAAVADGQYSVAIPLAEGPNTVTAVSSYGGGLTFSTSIQVTLDTTAPRVTIRSPENGLLTSEPTVDVSGIVNDLVVGTVNDQEAQVTVNGQPATVANRTFLHRGVPLNVGANTIAAVGRDRVGNAYTTEVTVHRIAPNTSRLLSLSGAGQAAPIKMLLGQPVVVRAIDGSGNPIAGRPVVFRVVENDGSVYQSVDAATAADVQEQAAMTVTTDAQGEARAYWRLGSRAGSGNHRVEAVSTGIAGSVVFNASASSAAPAKINVDSGLNQSGAVGGDLALPFVAVVTDDGNNRLANVPVTFSVVEGGGSLGDETAVTVVTDGDGRALATLNNGFLEGADTQLVVATFPGNPGAEAAFRASAYAPGNVRDTRVTGVVLDNENTPIPGVTMRLLLLRQGNTSALPQQVALPVVTDAQGQFSLTGAPVGVFKLMADGTTVAGDRHFPTLELDVVTVSGRATTVGMPIYLAALDQANKLCVTESSGGTLTLPEVPGFALTVPAGSATFPGGSKSGCISATPVNQDKVPMSPGFGQQPRFVVTIQPVGTRFSPPASLSIPNVDGLKPREITEMYSYDHDLSAFVAIGSGSVSDDGSVIRSDPGVGVLKAGWHCGGNPNQTGSAATCPTCKTCQGARCVPVSDKTPCDDGRFCTSCTDGPGPDCCDAGRCEGKRVEDQELGDSSLDPSAARDAFKKGADIIQRFNEAINAVSPCQFDPPEASFSFGASVVKTCCEASETDDGVPGIVPGVRGRASFGIGAQAECIVGVSAPFVGRAGALVRGSLSASVEGSAYLMGCDKPDCNLEFTGSADLALDAGIASVIADPFFGDELLRAEAFISVPGSLSASVKICDSGNRGDISGCIGPVRLVVSFSALGFIEASTEVALSEELCYPQ